MGRRPAISITTAVVIASTIVLFVGVVHWWRPFLDTKRMFSAGVPSPPAFSVVDQIVIAPGQAACMGDVTFAPDGDRVGFSAGTFRRPGPALTVSIDAPDYRTRTRVAGGYADNAFQLVAVVPPRRPVIGTLCVRVVGPTKIALAGTSEGRTRSRPTLTVAGRPVGANVALRLFSSRSEDYPQHLHAMIDHASAFRPWFQRHWMLYLLVALTVAGLPVAIVAALALSLRNRGSAATPTLGEAEAGS